MEASAVRQGEAAETRSQLSAAQAELATVRSQSLEQAGSAEGEKAKAAQRAHELEVQRAEAGSKAQAAATALSAAQAEPTAARQRCAELEEAVRQAKSNVESAAAEGATELGSLKEQLAAKNAQVSDCVFLPHSNLYTNVA